MDRSLKIIVVILSSLLVTTNASVIIVGAGISGISAARRLLEAGIDDFIILEARNTVGGRMQGFPFGGLELETGAAWITGTGTDASGGTNPMWKFAQEIGLDGSFSDFDSWVAYDWDGNQINRETIVRYWDEYDRVSERAAQYAETLDPNLDSSYDISLGDVHRLLGYQGGQSGPELWASNMVTWVDFDWHQAQNPNVSSVRGGTPYVTGELWGYGMYYTRGGFQRIPEYLAAPFMDKIQFNKAVISIEHDAGGVVVTTIADERFTADQVISTLSVGVMKSNLITWTPPLPVDIQDRLDKFTGDSLYYKLFLQFDTVFWDDEEYIYYASQQRGDHPIIVNMDSANYEPGSRILMFEQVEDEARQWERESLEQSVETAMVILRKIYGADIPEPSDATKVMWGIDPFYRMCYTMWPVGFSINDYRAMCAPVNNTLFFGGEHCIPEFHGFTHGGYIRGIHAAEELLSSVGMLDKSEIDPSYCMFCDEAPKFTGKRQSRFGGRSND